MKKKIKINPIEIILPDVVKQKVEAINNMSRAILELCAALNSTNVVVKIQDCEITSSRTGILIK